MVSLSSRGQGGVVVLHDMAVVTILDNAAAGNGKTFSERMLLLYVDNRI